MDEPDKWGLGELGQSGTQRRIEILKAIRNDYSSFAASPPHIERLCAGLCQVRGAAGAERATESSRWFALFDTSCCPTLTNLYGC